MFWIILLNNLKESSQRWFLKLYCNMVEDCYWMFVCCWCKLNVFQNIRTQQDKQEKLWCLSDVCLQIAISMVGFLWLSGLDLISPHTLKDPEELRSKHPSIFQLMKMFYTWTSISIPVTVSFTCHFLLRLQFINDGENFMYVIQLNGGCLLNGANICKNIIFFDIKVSFCLGKYTFSTRKSEVF